MKPESHNRQRLEGNVARFYTYLGSTPNSPYDTEARYGNKRHTTWLGYKVHLTETCEKNRVHLITNVQTTEAHLTDVDQTESIHQSLADKGLLLEL